MALSPYYIACESMPFQSKNGDFIQCDFAQAESFSQQQVKELFVPPLSPEGAHAVGAALWLVMFISWQGKKYIEMLRFH